MSQRPSSHGETQRRLEWFALTGVVDAVLHYLVRPFGRKHRANAA